MDFIVRDATGNSYHQEVAGQGTKENPFVPVYDQSTKRSPMYQYMDTVGDRSGDVNQGVDGSVTPVSFKVAPPAGSIYGIARLIFSLRDGGSFDSGGWGNNGGTPLTNGCKLIWRRNGIDIDLTIQAIDSHYILAGACHDMILATWGSGDQFLTARFTFTKAGQYLMLDGDQGDYLEILIRDDLTYLVDQRVSAQGYQTAK